MSVEAMWLSHDHPSQGARFDVFTEVSLNPLHYCNVVNHSLANMVIPPREYNYVPKVDS